MKIDQANHCISVVGPTACGKTDRALAIAGQLVREKKVAGVDVISADSRQVYKGLEILTGADVPEGFEVVTLRHAQCDTPQSNPNYFTNIDGSIRIFGISMIDPTAEWSLAHFVNFAREIMQWSWSNNRQPMLVGGTGLYHKHLFSDDVTPQIPQDLTMRRKAENMSVADLQRWLAEIDSARLEQMNDSDRENSRRLLRAIEVATWQKKHGSGSLTKSTNSPMLWSQVDNHVELVTAPLELIEKRIKQRVEKRFASGAIQEVKNLLKLKLPASAPVLTTLGVPEIRSYLNGEISAENCQQLWALHEFQYAKRQMTWWKKTENNCLKVV